MVSKRTVIKNGMKLIETTEETFLETGEFVRNRYIENEYVPMGIGSKKNQTPL